ncbi:MAG TPA: T9SS type B sorting domain-containing protein [Bacteroidia bacterium]|nr:T9SS type B sorting domain-containing protein [Bacteroidia bacterium]
MKIALILRVFLLTVLLELFSLSSHAQSKKLIHFWDFNNTVPTSGIGDVGANHDSLGNITHPLPAQYTSLPLSGAKIVYSRPHAIQTGATKMDSVLDNVTLGAFNYDYSSVHYPYFTASDSSVAALACSCSGNLSVRTRNPSLNSYMYLYVPTTGYMNILLSYAITASNNKGSQYNIFSYSTNGGTTWNNLTQAMDTFNIAGVKRPDTLLALNSVTVNHTWYPVSIDFSSAGSVNNDGNFIIRFYLTGSNAIGTTGFNAYDNFAIRGDSICPVIWGQPANSAVCAGSNTDFVTHESGGLNNTFQWQENTGSGFVNIINGGVYSGATSDSLELTNVTVGMNGYQYRCIIVCPSCNNDTSKSATLTVNPVPIVTANTTLNPVCLGGSVTLTGGGATTYTWTGGVTDGVPFSPPATQTYTVTGTNASGCKDTASITLVVSPVTVVKITPPNSTICSGGTGVSLTASNAVSYTWSPGTGLSSTNTATVNANPAGSTTYTVTGNVPGCTSGTQTVAITVSPTPTVSVTPPSTAICSGGTGTSLTANGAASYSWSPTGGLTCTNCVNPTVNPASTTTYTVTGTTASCTSLPQTVVVTVNTTPTVSVSAVPATICSGNSSTLTASGSATYLWSTGATTSSITVSPAATTTYTVTGTSAGCSGTPQTVTVMVNSTPTVTTSAAPINICSGNSSILTANGAATYSWSTGATTSSITVTPATTTTYTVTGTSTGCSSLPKTVTVLVNTTPTVTVSATPTTICSGNSSTLTVNGAATYLWSTGATSSSISISPGTTTTYTVTGTSTGCSSLPQTVTLTVNPTPTLTISAAPTAICSGSSGTLTIGGATTYLWSTGATSSSITVSPGTTTTYTVTGTTTGCSSSANTTVTVHPLPTVAANASANPICIGSNVTLTGSGAASYTWSGGVTNGVAFTPVATITYTVTGTDINGCVNTANITVTVNTLPTVTANASANPVCEGSSIKLTGGGASTYTWSGGVINGLAFVPASTQTYTVTGTDVNGCINTASTTVTVNPLPIVTANASANPVCAGSNITLTGGGASSYTWSSGITDGVAFVPAATQTYTVTGTDINGCVNTANITVTVHPLPTVTANASANPVCAGSNVTLTGGGASTYTWSGVITNGVAFVPATTQTYTVTGTDINGCVNTANITVTVDPLPVVTANTTLDTVCSGGSITLTGGGANTYIWTGGATNGVAFVPASTQTYTVTGTDINGCMNTANITVTVNSLPVVTATASADSVCAGGSITLNASGALTYSWSGGVTNGIPFVPASTQTYTVTGTDIHGCDNTANIKVLVDPIPTITIAPASPTLCFGDNTVLTAGGANTYSWSPSNSLSCTNCPSPIASPTVTTKYTVVGTSISGCIDSTTVTITVAAKITASISGKDTVCSGSSTTLAASGGTTYLWNTGATTPNLTISPVVNTTYSVKVTSASCSDSTQVTIIVNPTPAATISGTNSICQGASTTLSASGGISYTWSTSATTTSITVTPATTTTYSVTASNGLCNKDTSIVVTVSNLAGVNISGPQTICAGSPVTITASGGTSYLWSTGATATSSSITVTPISTTTYSVTVTNGACIKDTSSTITVNPLPLPSVSGNNIICSGDSTILTANGGISYVWNTGATTTSITVNPAATTTFTLQASNGLCIKDTTMVVTVNNIPVPVINGSQSICIGASANLTATGGSTYTWSTGSVGPTIVVSPTSTTTYTVTAANGTCTAKDSAAVIVNPLPVEVASPNTTIRISQSTPISVSPQTSGNIYSWYPVTDLSCTDCPDPIASPTSTTTYYVITTNSAGCSTEDTIEVIVNDDCGHLFIPNGFSPNRDGHNDQLLVYGFCIRAMDFIVFDRWGNKIFESTSQKDGWDGTYKGQPMNSDTYAYEFEATLIDGTKIHKSGNVALIR